MEHQDWKEVVFRKKALSKQEAQRTGQTVAIKKRPDNRHLRKLEEEDIVPDKVSHNLAQSIQQARTAKGWNRQDLAQRLNVKVGVIADYETGKGVPDPQLLQKMSRVLGVTLKKKM